MLHRLLVHPPLMTQGPHSTLSKRHFLRPDFSSTPPKVLWLLNVEPEGIWILSPEIVASQSLYLMHRSSHRTNLLAW